jgi:insulysin
MTLALVAPQPIEVLRNIVEKAFAGIPNRNSGPPEQAWAGIPPFSGAESLAIPSFGFVVEVVPVSDLRQVQITWPIVYRSQAEREIALLNKPSQYVAHLLGHEGPRSLLSYLKQKGWANTLAVASSEELSDFEAFEIVVGLTTRGLASVDKVVEAIYSCIANMRNRQIPDYVFKEVLQLEELQWRFLTRTNTGAYATSLATAMQRFSPALYVAGPRRLALDEYYVDSPQLLSMPRSSFSSKQQLERTREQVQDFINELKVDNAMLTILSKTFEGQTDRKEQWYGTDFRVREIPSITLAQWENCEPAKNLKIDFPRPNPFIPSEAGLRVKNIPVNNNNGKKSFEERMEPITPPRKIRDDGADGRWTVWFKEDDGFGKPKGFLVFQVLTKEVYASPMNAALANLYEISVSDRLREYAYDGKYTLDRCMMTDHYSILPVSFL